MQIDREVDEAPANRDAEGDDAEHDRHAGFEAENHHAPEEKGEQVLRPRHRRRDEPFHEVTAARIDDREAESPERVAHDAEAHQSGDDEVDIPAPRLAHQIVARGHRIDPSGRALDRPVGEQPRGSAVRVRIVVPENDPAVVRRLSEEHRLASEQRARRPCIVEQLDRQSGLRFERARDIRRRRDDGQHCHRPSAKRDAEGGRQQDRKEHRPEHRFRLADELADPREDQLPLRVEAAASEGSGRATHREDADRSARRTRLPAWRNGCAAR